MKKILKWIGIVFGSIGLLMLLFYILILKPQFDEQRKVSQMPIEDISVSQIPNGVYQGSFEYSGTGVLVEVKVEYGVIKHIEILKGAATPHGLPAEKIIVHIMDANSLNVDVITGSTLTSKAFLKAVERALKKGLNSAISY